MSAISVPVVDLACDGCDLVAEVGGALQRYGFFYIKNHGVDDKVIADQFTAARRLFALPSPAKQAMVFNATLDIGYTGGTGQAQSLDASKDLSTADTKEGFMLTNNAYMDEPYPQVNEADPLQGATLHWPKGVPGYKRAIKNYYAAAYRVNRRLNDLLFSSLQMDRAEQTRLGSTPFAVLKQLRYAPAAGASFANGSIGAGAHADWGSLTVLATDGTPGLEVELDGAWLPVPPKEGCLIVNAGDQIEALTNGHYRSARHRVITVSSSPRYSTAFFTYFNYRAKLAPLAQFVRPDRPLVRPPMDTLEWFQFKLRQSVGEDVASPAEANAALATNGTTTTTTTTTCMDESSGDDGAAANATAAAASSPAALIRRIHGAAVGVEAIGYDLVESSDREIDALVTALHTDGRGLLVVRNQTLGPEGLEIALRRLGSARGGFGLPLRYDRWPGQSPRLRGFPHLALLGNYRARRPDEAGTGAAVGDRIGEYKPAVDELLEWHTDGSFLPRPKVGIVLYAPSLTPIQTCAPCDPATLGWWRKLLPFWPACKPRCQPAPESVLPAEGGQTAFASGLAAYDAMSDEEKAALDGLKAIHSWCDFMHFLEARDPKREKVTDAQCAAKPEVAWPLVRTHPVTNKRALYVNAKNGLRVVSSADGAPAPAHVADGLILNLTARILATGVYKHTWAPGDFVVWDNRVLLHAATPFDPTKYERLIYRAEYPGEPVYSY